MRTRDIRIGQWVKVRSYASGDAASLRNKIGKVLTVGVANAVVDFDGRRHSIEARWLETASEPTPGESSELAAFKTQVAQVAQRYARRHGLCEIVDEALAELGIKPAPRGTVRIVLEIPEAQFDDYHEDDENLIDEIVAGYGGLSELLENATSSERTEWTKSAEYVDKEN